MNSGNYRQEEKKILDQILDREVYDARMRPNGYNASDGPTIVNVNLYFRSFEKIDDVKMVRFLIYYTTHKLPTRFHVEFKVIFSQTRFYFRRFEKIEYV